MSELRYSSLKYTVATISGPNDMTANIFDIQDQITRSIVTEIIPELSDTEHARALRRPPGSLDAWELYHRGRWHAHRLTELDLSEANNLLRKSIELDINFAADLRCRGELHCFPSPIRTSNMSPRHPNTPTH